MTGQFATLFNAWLTREQLTRSQAIARLGTASQVPYDYASGLRLPQVRFIPDLARRMGVPETELRAAIDADRAARRAADAPAEAMAGAAAAPTSDRASAPPVAPVGPGW